MKRPSFLHVGGTLYWTIRLYNTTTQALVDADSTPTVAIRKNGASTADSVTITKRSATTGIYDCSYNPASEVEGDEFTVEEAAVISSTTYSASWEFSVIAVERGTNSAALATDLSTLASYVDTEVAAIKVKTDNLPADPADASDIAAAFSAVPGAIRTELTTELGRIDATVSSRLASASYSAPPTAGTIADAVWDEAYSGHTTSGTFGKLMDIIRKSNLSIDGTVTTTVAPTTTAFTTNVSASTGAYEHSVLLFTTGALVGQNSPILTFTSTNGAIVVEEAFTAAPSNGDEFIIVAASHVHSIAGIQQGLALAADLATLDDKVDTIDGLIDQIIAEVVTSQSMPGQGAPPASLKLATAIMYLYKQFRNKKTQTNSEYKLFADNGSTVDQKSTVSDDGTTTTVGEMDTGA